MGKIVIGQYCILGNAIYQNGEIIKVILQKGEKGEFHKMSDLSTLSTDNKIMIIDTEEIYKSNKLIESSYQLTTAQNRIIYMGMRRLKKVILDKNTNLAEVEIAMKAHVFDPIFIETSEYRKLFNIKSNRIYEELENIVTSLYLEEILYFDEDGDLGRKRWLIGCKYNKEKKGIKLEFNPALIRDLVIFQDQYTKLFNDNFINKLKSKYSFRIYELTKQYINIGHRDFYLEDFKFKLRILEDEYSVYSNLKSRVIKKAIAEINKHTDINLDFMELEKDKKTRKVIKIRFVIKSQTPEKETQKGQISLFDTAEEESVVTIDDTNIVYKLSNILGIQLTAKEADIIFSKALDGIDKHGLQTGVLDYIKEKKQIADNYIRTKQNGDINYIAVLNSSLSNNWSVNKKPNTPKIKFTSYEQREFDPSLENKLLGWDDKE